MTTLSILLLSAAVPSAADDSVLLEFSTPACYWCQQMQPVMQRLKQEGHPIRKIDGNQRPDLARKYGVSGYPTFVLLIDGRRVDQVVGATTEANLRRLLAQIPSPIAQSRPSPNPQQPPPTSRPSRSPSQSVPVTLADSKSTDSPRFQIPFLGRMRGKREDVEPPFASSDLPVVRAKYDRSDNDEPAGDLPASVAATVRIRVKDSEGVNFGSGTVIESRKGQALVLTCGHIFRHLQQGSKIYIDVLTEQGSETFVGKLIDHDLNADVGLVEVPVPFVVNVAQVAAGGTPISPDETVFSVGCGGGKSPTSQKLRITARNRYRGPDNIECTGLPVQGRSGGGLFNADDQLIGVCFAANSDEQRGLYAGLEAVHQLLDRAGLQRIYDSPGSAPQRDGRSQTELVEGSPLPAGGENPFQGGGQEAASRTGNPPERGGDARLAAQIAEAQELAQNAGDVEVICIIRPVNKPQAASRVVIINRASSKFLSYLNGEAPDSSRDTLQQASARR